jgi:hypothetical protein
MFTQPGYTTVNDSDEGASYRQSCLEGDAPAAVKPTVSKANTSAIVSAIISNRFFILYLSGPQATHVPLCPLLPLMQSAPTSRHFLDDCFDVGDFFVGEPEMFVEGFVGPCLGVVHDRHEREHFGGVVLGDFAE